MSENKKTNQIQPPEEIVLCGASAYNQKFYINENFKNLPDESKNILEYIRVAGNNLLEQVDTILAYSKLEAGMLTLKDKTYNIYEMIEEL